MRRMKKVLLLILLLGILTESALLGVDTHNYLKYKYANLNINGRIICMIDNLTNFSGMAT